MRLNHKGTDASGADETVPMPFLPSFRGPLLVVFLFLAASLPAQQKTELAPVISRRVERALRLPGEFLPYEKVDLFSRVNAFVENVRVDRGSVVKEGDLLVLLSAPDLTAQRAEADAKALAAESQQAEAQAKVVAAESTFDRLKEASSTPGAVAQNELIQAGKTLDAARALLRAAEASGKAAKQSAEALRELESYLRVRAPFAGVITERLVHPGAFVGPGSGSTPMLRLEQNSRLRLVVSVPEASAAGIERGARVPFTVPAYPGEIFSGVVARIAHSVDPRTRTMPVEADVNNAAGRLAPGMFPEVRWPVRRPGASLLVPRSAVVTTTERTFVIRANNGRAEWVDVSRGAPEGDLVEVFGPLKPGDRIVRRATDEIRDGAAL